MAGYHTICCNISNELKMYIKIDSRFCNDTSNVSKIFNGNFSTWRIYFVELLKYFHPSRRVICQKEMIKRIIAYSAFLYNVMFQLHYLVNRAVAWCNAQCIRNYRSVHILSRNMRRYKEY